MLGENSTIADDMPRLALGIALYPTRFSIPGILRSVLTIIALSYVGLCLFMCVRQRYYVFYPSHDINGTPELLGLDFETLEFTDASSNPVSAWVIPGKELSARKDKWVVFCHGNAGNISHRLETIDVLHNAGFSTLIFDYTGYGQSPGTPSEKAIYTNADAAWEYLTRERGVSPAHIIVFGRSLGGPVAAYLASKNEPALLIVESSFRSIPAMANEIYPFLPASLICRIRLPTEQYISESKCPVAVLHSRHDGLVPYEHGKALYAAAPDPKLFLDLSGNHNETMAHDKYGDVLEQVFTRFLPKPQ